MIICISFVNIVFIALAFGINKNNAVYLLAGYNAMSKDSREKFDIDGFLIFFKKFFLQISIFSTLIFPVIDIVWTCGFNCWVYYVYDITHASYDTYG